MKTSVDSTILTYVPVCVVCCRQRLHADCNSESKRVTHVNGVIVEV